MVDLLPPTVFKNGVKGRTWRLDPSKLSCERYVIPIGDVIVVRDVRPPNPKKFEVVYARRGRKNVWSTYAITFKHGDTNVIRQWVQTIQDQISRMGNRPKKVVMFVNPFGGKGKGVQVYENYAKPLFDVAGVEMKVVVTHRRNEIRDTLMEEDNLDDVDGVVCIGGDGTACEAFTGLVLRECRLNGIDPNDQSARMPRPSMKVGVIPCGSTDTTTFCLHGTTDVVTAILHIIMGRSLGLDLVSVHHDNQLLQVCSNAISYGFLGDVVYHSEKLRWMGPSRYEYVGAKKMLLNGGYKGTVSILGNEIDEKERKCYENCNRCSSTDDSGTNSTDKWVEISSNFFVLAGANMTCAGERSPHGLAPYCHLGDGYLHILIVHHTSLYKRLRTFQRFSQTTYSMADLPHVQTYRGREFSFKADDGHGRWNCDGEPILHTNIHAKVHRQLITVFSRGIPEHP